MLKNVSQNTKIQFPKRKYGVEIEFYGLKRTSIKKILDSAKLSNSFRTNSSNKWYIKDDNSIGVYDHSSLLGQQSENYADVGTEISSPKLSGLKGIKEVKKIASALRLNGAFVNQSCGLHVHLDASDLSPKEILYIAEKYADLEKEIDSWLSKDRSGNNCSAAYSARDMISEMIATHNDEKLLTRAEIVDLSPGRNYKVNLESLFRHGTIEFRHHHGTLSGESIECWITFLLFFVEQCKKEASEATLRERKVKTIEQRILEQLIVLTYLPSQYERQIERVSVVGPELRTIASKIRSNHSEDLGLLCDTMIKDAIESLQEQGVPIKKNEKGNYYLRVDAAHKLRKIKGYAKNRRDFVAKLLGRFGEENPSAKNDVCKIIYGIDYFDKKSNKSFFVKNTKGACDQYSKRKAVFEGIPPFVISYYLEVLQNRK